jgi:hypothetical protein
MLAMMERALALVLVLVLVSGLTLARLHQSQD